MFFIDWNSHLFHLKMNNENITNQYEIRNQSDFKFYSSVIIRILEKIGLLIFDMIVLAVVGVIMAFLMYFLNGKRSENILKYGPNIMSQCAVIHCYCFRILDLPSVKRVFKKRSKWFCFSLYYIPVFLVSYGSIHVLFAILKHVFHTLETGFENMIGFHQFLVFVTLPIHNVWFGGVLLKKANPIAAAVLQCLAVWVIWGI